MNVTVHVAGALQGALDGRRKVELGMPSGAELPDVLQTLISLYPKLRVLIPHESKARALQLNVMYEPANEAMPLRMIEGQRLYLVAGQPKRLSDSAA